MNLGNPPPQFRAVTHRLTEVSLRDDDDRINGRHRVLSSLAVSHGAGREVVVGWVRPRARSPIHVVVGGVETRGIGNEVAIAFPPGARGRELRPGEADKLLGGLHWAAALLQLDAGNIVGKSFADKLEDLFALTSDPMGLVVVAQAMSATESTTAINVLSDELARLEAVRTGRGVHRRELARVEDNLVYLDQHLGTGLWQLTVWTAGATAAQAAVTTALLAGAAEVAEGPLAMRNAGPTTLARSGWSTVCVVGADAVAGLARPPFHELPGVRVTPLPEFDQNVEDTVEVRIGAVLDRSRSPAAPFGFSLDALNRHAFVCGATGAGKSETVRSLLWSASQQGIPWLAIEPAKSEYAALAPWLDPSNPLIVIRPGDRDVPPPMLNPLEPSSIVVNGVRHTFPLQTHLDMVRALFTASFDAAEPFPQVLSEGLTRAFESRGWNLVTGEASDRALTAPEWPVLGDLVRESLQVVKGLGYGQEVTNNVRGFIKVRIESLRSGTPGRFFEGGHPLDLGQMLSRPVVFEIEDLGDDRDKAFFIGTLVIRLVELLRMRLKHKMQPAGLSHLLVIEEAHRLLRRVAEESPAAHAVTMFANLLAEIRAYGEGVIVAEQIPSKVMPDLVKNSAIKIMHRLPAEDDRATVGSSMNLDARQSQYVVALAPGQAVAHTAGMDRPVLVAIDRVAGHARTGAVPARPSLGSRSSACASPCTTSRCTLAEMSESRDLVTPAVALWVEQVVTAHLTWDRIGEPRGTWFGKLRVADPHRLRCALVTAVGEAIGRRRELIRQWYDPAALEVEVVGRLVAQVMSGRGIDRPPPRWAIGQYRYTSIERDLIDETAPGDRSTPHPLTSRWSAAGIDLPGSSWAEQLRLLKNMPRSTSTITGGRVVGSEPVLDDLARRLGRTDSTERRRIIEALKLLGLEHRWLTDRMGLPRE